VSLAVTLLLCQLVRRSPVTRFLFGLKPDRRPSRPARRPVPSTP
jgi:hypothetical protein